MEDAPTIGKIQTGEKTATAHVLFAKPLMIGTALSNLNRQTQTVFHPLSPALHAETARCELVGESEEMDYAVMKCEEVEGSGLRLRSVYPKLTTAPSSHFLSFNPSFQSKVLGQGPPSPSDSGGYVTDKLGSNHMTAVLTSSGIVPVSDPHLHDLFDRHIWPLCRLYSRSLHQHYFTYFRQFEEDNGLQPTGNESRLEARNTYASWELAIREKVRGAYFYVRRLVSKTQ